MKTPEEMVAYTLADEEKYQFTSLTHQDIWDLGSIYKELSDKNDVPVAIEIDLNGTNVFRYLPQGTNASNIMWLERKRKTVQMMEKSSLRVFAELAVEGKTLESAHSLVPATHANCGGGFPIRMRNGGCVVGFIGISGLPHVMDHDMLTRGLAQFFATHPQT